MREIGRGRYGESEDDFQRGDDLTAYRILKGFKVVVLAAILLGPLCGCGGGGGSAVNINSPSSITADAGVQRVILNWSPIANVNVYNIYYSTSPGVTKAKGIKVPDEHGPYTARDLQNGATYYFAITAVNEKGESALSREVSATPSAKPPPYAPTYIKAAAEDGKVRVSWANSREATSYQVYYSRTPGVNKTTGAKVAGAISPQVIPFSNDVPYYFVVTASNANGESATSFEVSATPRKSPPLPPSTWLNAVEGNQQVAITWPEVQGATAYNIYYATDIFVTNKTGIKIAEVKSPHIITGLKNKTGYFFVLTAVRGGEESADSPAASATPLVVKPLPAMVLIPGGTFQMGDNLDGTTYAMPVHKVNIDGFYIDKYETKYELWKSVYDWAVQHGYNFDNPGRNGSISIGTNMPVTTVSWYDVVKWLNARSEKEQRTPVYYTDAAQTKIYRAGKVDVMNSHVKWDADGYRLPTEAEFEKAERGGVLGRRYPWGSDLGTGNGNYNMGKTTSVGVYPANGYGLYDMAGNVWEWTWDWSSEDYKWASDGTSNPRGPDVAPKDKTRVRRGGGWSYGYKYLRCFERMFRIPTYTGPYFGFRSASNKP